MSTITYTHNLTVNANGGTFNLAQGATIASGIASNASAATIQSALITALGNASITVTGTSAQFTIIVPNTAGNALTVDGTLLSGSAVITVVSAVPYVPSGGVSSVTNSDGTITVSPNTGTVVVRVTPGTYVPVPFNFTLLNPSGDVTGATDSAAINAATAALIAKGGGSLVLGGGTFYVTGTSASLGTARLKIVGQGQATVVNNVASGAGSIANCSFYVYAGPIGGENWFGINWIEISDMTLVGGSTGGTGIYLDSCYQGELNNIFAKNFTSSTVWGTGIFLIRSIEMSINNPVVVGSNYGLYFNTCNINNVHGGWLGNNASGTGIFLAPTSAGNNFYGTVTQLCSIGVEDEGQGQHYSNCWFEDNTIGYHANSRNSVCDGGIFALNTTDIVVATGSANTVIRAPYFLTGTAVVHILNGAGNTVVEDPGLLTLAMVNDQSGGQFAIVNTLKTLKNTGTWITGTNYGINDVVIVSGSAWSCAVAHTAASTFAADVSNWTQIGASSTAIVNTVAAAGAAITLPSSMLNEMSAVVLTANITFTFPTPFVGQSFSLLVVQGGSGSYTATWGSTVAWPSASAPTLSTAIGHADLIEFSCFDGSYWIGRVVAANIENYTPFTPAAISNLTVWLDAAAMTATADGASLATWTDESGNSNNAMASGAAEPTYYKTTSAKLVNGKPAVWFNGTSQYMATAAFGSAISQPATIFVVTKLATNGAAALLLDGITSGSRMALLTSPWGLFYGSEVDSAVASTTGLHLVTALVNSSSSFLRLDGLQITGTAAGGSDTLTGLTVGARYNGVEWWNGAICEVIVYAAALTSIQITQVENYLANKWGAP